MRTGKAVLVIGGFIVLAMCMSACGYKSMKQGAAIDQRKAEQDLVDGRTTRQDVITEFGLPTKTMDNERTYFYTWTEGRQTKVAGYTSQSTTTKSLIIMFTPEGIVASHHVSNTEKESQSGFGMGEEGKK